MSEKETKLMYNRTENKYFKVILKKKGEKVKEIQPIEMNYHDQKGRVSWPPISYSGIDGSSDLIRDPVIEIDDGGEKLVTLLMMEKLEEIMQLKKAKTRKPGIWLMKPERMMKQLLN